MHLSLAVACVFELFLALWIRVNKRHKLIEQRRMNICMESKKYTGNTYDNAPDVLLLWVHLAVVARRRQSLLTTQAAGDRVYARTDGQHHGKRQSRRLLGVMFRFLVGRCSRELVVDGVRYALPHELGGGK
jgi:hypothetical protein